MQAFSCNLQETEAMPASSPMSICSFTLRTQHLPGRAEEAATTSPCVPLLRFRIQVELPCTSQEMIGGLQITHSIVTSASRWSFRNNRRGKRTVICYCSHHASCDWVHHQGPVMSLPQDEERGRH